jgi:hypothetical protein
MKIILDRTTEVVQHRLYINHPTQLDIAGSFLEVLSGCGGPEQVAP